MWGTIVTIVMLFIEYFINYDRVLAVIEDNPQLAPYETLMRIFSTIIMIIIWPWSLFNFVRSFIKGIIKAFKDHE